MNLHSIQTLLPSYNILINLRAKTNVKEWHFFLQDA